MFAHSVFCSLFLRFNFTLKLKLPLNLSFKWNGNVEFGPHGVRCSRCFYLVLCCLSVGLFSINHTIWFQQMPISLAPQIPAFGTRTPFWDKQEARSTSWWFLIIRRIFLCYLLPSYILSLFQSSVVICFFISRHLQLILLWRGQIKLVCQRCSDSLMSDERRCLYMKVNPTFERLTAVCSSYICNCSVLIPVIWSNQDYTFLF